MYECGPEKLGIKVCINVIPEQILKASILSVDVEDADGEFVGIGLYAGGTSVCYLDSLSRLPDISSRRFVGQNFKSDLHKLRKWGRELDPDRVLFDTRLASYVCDSSSQEHGLKANAKKLLGIEYPTYEDIVTHEVVTTNKKGEQKVKKVKGTLKDVPVELVADYNAMDCIATWRVWRWFDLKMTTAQKLYFDQIELPTMRVLYDMEKRGIKIDTKYLEALDKDFEEKIVKATSALYELVGQEFNPNSPIQVVEVLNKKGVPVKGADQKKDLAKYKHNPIVKALIGVKELAKLRSTYTKTLVELANQDVSHRIHTSFNQSTVSGRLSSSEPNLQNIPTKTELGAQIRKGFVAEEGNVLIVADYSQIDLRCLAHESKERVWMEAFKTGGDPHQAVADSINKVTKLNIERREGKTLNFAMTYGAGAYKVASELGIPGQKGEQLVAAFWRGLKDFATWKKDVCRVAYKRKGIRTVLGRFIPIPLIRSDVRELRASGERNAVAYTGQGGSADLVKRAAILCRRKGFIPLLQVHDELVWEVPVSRIGETIQAVEQILNTVAKLRVPLETQAGSGRSWAEAGAEAKS